jgi:predicted HicB family RNase H-like nuclease
MARKRQAKIGRPPKRKGERLSKNRTFRVRGTLDEQLAAAADAAGRSVSEEIEYRLERSFWREEIEGKTVELQVRLPERLQGRLEEAAKNKGWSMNTEIVDRLDVSFQLQIRQEMEMKAAQEGVAAAKVFEEGLSHPPADKEEKPK